MVQMTSGLLPGVDRDLGSLVSRRLKTHLHTIILNTKVAEFADGIHVRLEGKDLEQPEQVFDQVLLAVGRKPNINGIGLENTEVAINEKRFIQVDAQR